MHRFIIIIMLLGLAVCCSAAADEYQNLAVEVSTGELQSVGTLLLTSGTRITSTDTASGVLITYGVQGGAHGFGSYNGWPAILFDNDVVMWATSTDIWLNGDFIPGTVGTRRLGYTGTSAYPWGEAWLDTIMMRQTTAGEALVRFFGVAGTSTATVRISNKEGTTPGPYDSVSVWLPAHPGSGSSVLGMTITSNGFLPVQLGADPSGPAEGQCIWRTDTHKLRCWDGTGWQDGW